MYPLHAIPIARPNTGQALLPISYTQVKSPDSKRETVENGECKNNRYRCPALEAGIQVFFRILTILLHIGTLVAVVIAKESSHVDIRFYCGILSLNIFLCLWEIIALGNPLFSIGPFIRRPFPRLPSFYLAIAESVALAMVVWTIEQLMSSETTTKLPWLRPQCPYQICVTGEEKILLIGYALQMITMIIHFGFLIMSVSHWLHRKVPDWLEYWGY